MSASVVDNTTSSIADADVCTIRLYKDTDEDDVMEVCSATAPENAQAEPVRTVVPYIFALPYIRIHPEYCWVVDDGTGKAVGYLVAVPDSAEYLRRIKEEFLPMFKRDVLPELIDRNPGLFASPFAEDMGEGDMLDAQMSPGNEIERVGRTGGPQEVAAALVKRFWKPDESILHRTWPKLLQEYPCHLHIDILPDYQGKNLGTKLMKELTKKLKKEGVKGIHLIKAADNHASERFYDSCGFKRYQDPTDGSKIGKAVNPGGGACMVMKVGEEKE